HHRALGAQTKLLTHQRNAVELVPAPDGETTTLSATPWWKETDALVQKFREWEKELGWGAAAVGMGERSCVGVFPPYRDDDDDDDDGDDEDEDEDDDREDDDGEDDDGGLDGSFGLGPAQG
ncbi:MAG: hypothetical protein LQ349_008440, partial [Xanthoria aureola]